MTVMLSLAALFGRTMLVLIFPLSALDKIGAYAGTQSYMEAMGVPGELLPATIAFEVIAPLFVIAGFHARSAAFLLAGFSLITALVFHYDLTDQIQSILFLKNISIAGGLVLLTASGPGALSIKPAR